MFDTRGYIDAFTDTMLAAGAHEVIICVDKSRQFLTFKVRTDELGNDVAVPFAAIAAARDIAVLVRGHAEPVLKNLKLK